MNILYLLWFSGETNIFLDNKNMSKNKLTMKIAEKIQRILQKRLISSLRQKLEWNRILETIHWISTRTYYNSQTKTTTKLGILETIHWILTRTYFNFQTKTTTKLGILETIHWILTRTYFNSQTKTRMKLGILETIHWILTTHLNSLSKVRME